MNSRYPRIRETYAGAALVRALDRVDALSQSPHPNSLVRLVLIQYLDILEAALIDEREGADRDSLLHRALDAAHQALDTYGLLDAEDAPPLNENTPLLN